MSHIYEVDIGGKLELIPMKRYDWLYTHLYNQTDMYKQNEH